MCAWGQKSIWHPALNFKSTCHKILTYKNFREICSILCNFVYEVSIKCLKKFHHNDWSLIIHVLKLCIMNIIVRRSRCCCGCLKQWKCLEIFQRSESESTRSKVGWLSKERLVMCFFYGEKRWYIICAVLWVVWRSRY